MSEPTPVAVTQAVLSAPRASLYKLAEHFRTLPPRMTIKQYMAWRGCCRSYVYVLVRAGRIKIIKDGRKSYIDTVSAIDDMMSLPEAGAGGQ